MSASTDSLALIKTLSYYLGKWEEASDYVQRNYLPGLDTKTLYEEVCEQWFADPLRTIMPPVGDKLKREAYFSRCDEICESKPATPHEYV